MRRLVLAVTPQEALRLARAIEEGRALTVMRDERDFSPLPPHQHDLVGAPYRRPLLFEHPFGGAGATGSNADPCRMKGGRKPCSIWVTWSLA